MGLIRSIGRLISSTDLYGTQIGLTFKGRQTYNSVIGGLISICVILVIGGYALWQTWVLIG